jgi:hypothetical protein
MVRGISRLIVCTNSGTRFALLSAMAPTDTVNLYADSPERMLVLSILFLLAVALLILSNRWGAKPVYAATPLSQQRSKPKVDSRRIPAEVGTSPRAPSAA